MDRGAPAPLYLGPKAFGLFDDLKLITDESPFLLKGRMYFNGTKIEGPLMHTVPMDKFRNGPKSEYTRAPCHQGSGNFEAMGQ